MIISLYIASAYEILLYRNVINKIYQVLPNMVFYKDRYSGHEVRGMVSGNGRVP